MQSTSFLGSALRGRQPCRQGPARGQQVTTCVATPSKPPTSNPPKRSAVELIKEKSDFLRHPLMQGEGARGARRAWGHAGLRGEQWGRAGHAGAPQNPVPSKPESVRDRLGSAQLRPIGGPRSPCTDGRRQHRCRSPAGSRNRCAGRVEPAGLRSSPRTSRAASAHPGRPHPPVPRADLVSPEANVSEESVQLIKFHGSYQQDNREARTFGAGKAYQFMMRTRQPGGVVTNQLYLVMDELADLVGGGRVAGWVGVGGWEGCGWLARVMQAGAAWWRGAGWWRWGGACARVPVVQGLLQRKVGAGVQGGPRGVVQESTKVTGPQHRRQRGCAGSHTQTLFQKCAPPFGSGPTLPVRRPPPRPAQYGNGTLRLTTRQTYQLHGVLKQDLKTVFSTVLKNMGTTLGACGDVNRNVMAPPAPYNNRADYALAIK